MTTLSAEERADIIAREDGYVPPVEEESMGDTSPIVESEDRTEEDAYTPEKFDLARWIAGAKPTRRGTVVYGRSDLLAQMDILAENARIAAVSGDDTADKLMEQVQGIREEMEASALDVVVEASSEAARDRLRSELGIKPDTETTIEQNLAWISAHIVEPKGFDASILAQLYELSPRQVDKIANAVKIANEAAPAVPAPFSLPVSGRRGTPGSSKR